ncbi:rhodanese-like protein [Oesophagostomum dentatum]|uniref:Rhodanese-like protein n=1 Tax=Oesophagostomum dentatum TaxID=61180 RepID=A0A0B1T9F5_OESDE|nr:rhodanese-like protein [Oesophagostomum dentatum]
MFDPLVAFFCLTILRFTLAVDDVVSTEWLDKHRKSIVLLDATYDVKPKPDYKEFKKKYYGNFDELMKIETNATRDYAKEHIPGAVHFNFEAAYYPSQYIRHDLYPPEEFEKYVRKLGINANDHIVIYARGRFAGMLFAARAWWTFKVYGHEKVSILDGGLQAWKKGGKSVTDAVTTVAPGNWKAKPINKSLLITFEELSKKNPRRKSLFEDLTKAGLLLCIHIPPICFALIALCYPEMFTKILQINYLDARPEPLFSGADPFEFPGKGATGNHLKGAKNVPLAAVMNEDGMKPKEEIEKALKKAGFDPSLPTVTACTQGFQATLLSIALRRVGTESRMYNGSMHEIVLRDPKLISEKQDLRLFSVFLPFQTVILLLPHFHSRFYLILHLVGNFCKLKFSSHLR